MNSNDSLKMEILTNISVWGKRFNPAVMCLREIQVQELTKYHKIWVHPLLVDIWGEKIKGRRKYKNIIALENITQTLIHQLNKLITFVSLKNLSHGTKCSKTKVLVLATMISFNPNRDSPFQWENQRDSISLKKIQIIFTKKNPICIQLWALSHHTLRKTYYSKI